MAFKPPKRRDATDLTSRTSPISAEHLQISLQPVSFRVSKSASHADPPSSPPLALFPAICSCLPGFVLGFCAHSPTRSCPLVLALLHLALPAAYHARLASTCTFVPPPASLPRRLRLKPRLSQFLSHLSPPTTTTIPSSDTYHWCTPYELQPRRRSPLLRLHPHIRRYAHPTQSLTSPSVATIFLHMRVLRSSISSAYAPST